MSNTISNPVMQSETAKDFITNRNLQVVPEVRTNVNGYPYITFINKDNEADNIYFSKSTAPHYRKGDSIQKGFFTGIRFVLVTYEDNREDQWKMTNSTGNRLEASDLF